MPAFGSRAFGPFLLRDVGNWRDLQATLRYGVGVEHVREPDQNALILRPQDIDLRNVPDRVASDHIARNRAAWEHGDVNALASGRRARETDELRWGVWQTPESELRLLSGFEPGEDAIELGAGSAATSAWLARHGLRPVAIDISRAQLRTAETLQREFDETFRLLHANAEEVPFDSESFDLAVSEYGASLWCDPRRWVVEAHRLLRPGGRLVFVTASPLLITCTPYDDSAAETRLVREHFARYRVEFDTTVEFHLSHANWIRLLRVVGFEIDDLIEVQASPGAVPSFGFVTAEWGARWPSEDIWIAHRAD